MPKKKAIKAKAARSVRNLPAKKLTNKQARNVKGGSTSLDAGVRFKYDIKGQKEG